MQSDFPLFFRRLRVYEQFLYWTNIESTFCNSFISNSASQKRGIDQRNFCSQDLRMSLESFDRPNPFILHSSNEIAFQIVNIRGVFGSPPFETRTETAYN